jgi:hypothetical protein
MCMYNMFMGVYILMYNMFMTITDLMYMYMYANTEGYWLLVVRYR